MARKSNKLAKTYGKKSVTRKKERPLKLKSESENTITEHESAAAPTPPPIPARTIPRPSAARTAEATYAYVMSDMKKVGIIGAAIFITLIVLSFIL